MALCWSVGGHGAPSLSLWRFVTFKLFSLCMCVCVSPSSSASSLANKKNSSKLIFLLLQLRLWLLPLSAWKRAPVVLSILCSVLWLSPLCSSQQPAPLSLSSIPRYCHFCPLTALAFMQFCFWRVIDFMLLLLMVFFLWFKLISIMHKYGKPSPSPSILLCPALSTYLSPLTVHAPIQVMRMLKLPWHFFANSQYFFLMISSRWRRRRCLFYMYRIKYI